MAVVCLWVVNRVGRSHVRCQHTVRIRLGSCVAHKGRGRVLGRVVGLGSGVVCRVCVFLGVRLCRWRGGRGAGEGRVGGSMGVEGVVGGSTAMAMVQTGSLDAVRASEGDVVAMVQQGCVYHIALLALHPWHDATAPRLLGVL